MKKILALTMISLLTLNTLLALTLISFPVSAASTTVSISDVFVESGEITTASIMINDVENLSGAHILLTYDPSVVHVTDIGNSDLDFETYKDINNSAGYTRYVVVNLQGPLEGPNIKFADVILEALGDAGSSCTMEVEAISMQDSNYDEIPQTYINGIFTITIPNVVGHWKFDEGSGTEASDSSGNGNTGTINDAEWTTGKIGSALEFDGEGDYVDIPGTFLDPNGEGSIAFWMDSSLPGEWNCILRGTTNSYRIEQNGPNVVLAGYTTNGASDNLYISPLTANEWNFVVFTYNTEHVSGYVNGILINEKDIVGNTQELRNIELGRWLSGSEHFDGIIDDVCVYNRVLSEEEIIEHYEEAL